jgi:hypothetical protein
MTESRGQTIIAVAVAAPVVLATCAVLLFSGLELRGRTPLSDGPVQNIAEAAGLGHASEVLRLLAAGENPNQVRLVRQGIISSTITKVTALEAAIWSRRVQLVELMDRRGAIVDGESRRQLACLAHDLPNPVDEIVDYLSPQGPPDCVPGQALSRVEARSVED